MTGQAERIRIELYASNLKNIAGAFKGTSDPYCVVAVLPNNPNEQPRVVGKTEVVKNCLSPRWTKTIVLEHTLGEETHFSVRIYDEIIKAKTNKLMGSALFEVGEVLGSRGNLKAKSIRSGGTLYCRAMSALATEESAGVLQVGLRGIKLKNKGGLISKSDPFVEVSAKTLGRLAWQPVYRSKHIRSNLNPVWPAFALDLNRFCAATGGDGTFDTQIDITDRPILISVWDWEKSGKHKSLGQFETTIGALMLAETADAGRKVRRSKKVSTDQAFILHNTSKKKGPRKELGKIVVMKARICVGGGHGKC